MTHEANQQRSAASDDGIPRLLRNRRVSRRGGAPLSGIADRNVARDAAIRAVTAIRRVMLAPFLPLTLALAYVNDRAWIQGSLRAMGTAGNLR